ncbi:hypothetical protein [Natrinema longum]|uniref:RCK C-terminal domain-containing protein n=1 Tax=Natrinema longum TaxID=370324 RepID=A0A8A2U8P9_9EURY|nr:hypothetical protein [Natrinema longum]MBZ6493613.1 hypothetical protein [Natrinema longum]QSW85044.1 hypothetical protein J0X27_16600 [Natrinema longum]
MAPLPYEALIGISYGLLVGFVPAILVGLAAVGVGIALDRPLPLLVGIVPAPVAVATGIDAGVFAPGFSHAPRIAMAAVVAGLLGVVTTNQGNRVAAELPQSRSLPVVRGPTLSVDAVDAVDAMGQVTIRPTGAIREFEGYPPLSPELRTTIEDGAWRLPADLQLSELERRLERRLRTEYGLSLVDVSIDGRGRATVAAAPPAKGVATTLSAGTRAVTVSGLLPTGIEPGDRVAIAAGDESVRGDVLSIDDGGGSADDRGTAIGSLPVAHRAATIGFDGGVGRVTVAVETTAATRLLDAPRHRIVVLPSGDNHALEAATLLEEAGRAVTSVELGGDSRVAAETLGVCSDDQWRFAADVSPTEGDRAFVAGTSPEVNDR